LHFKGILHFWDLSGWFQGILAFLFGLADVPRDCTLALYTCGGMWYRLDIKICICFCFALAISCLVVSDLFSGLMTLQHLLDLQARHEEQFNVKHQPINHESIEDLGELYVFKFAMLARNSFIAYSRHWLDVSLMTTGHGWLAA
jgi:hypothetical protein